MCLHARTGRGRAPDASLPRVTPRFFASAEELRAWFRDNHDKLDEQWFGYFKKGTGIPSVDWPQSVDVALCFGWIDGIRKSRDAISYMIRFTPRRPRSRWSARNVARIEELAAAGLVEEAGLAAFSGRSAEPTLPATASDRLPARFESAVRSNPSAWSYYRSARPSYRKQVALWVTSASKEVTRLRRLETLIECCAGGEPVPPLRWIQKGGRRARVTASSAAPRRTPS